MKQGTELRRFQAVQATLVHPLQEVEVDTVEVPGAVDTEEAAEEAMA